MPTRLIRIFLTVLASFFLTASSALAQTSPPFDDGQLQVEGVTSFSSDVVVATDGTISVTERIDYFFPEPRHGFYRDLPIRYEMENGEDVIVPIEVKSVEGGPFELEKTKTTVRVRIGDPDKTVTGTQTYVIKYVASGALRYFGDHDEIFWNVTGDEWTVPIERVTADIHLPDGVDKETVRMACYTGPFGSDESDCLYHRANTSASFAAESYLTVVVGWGPTGLVAKLLPQKPSFWNDFVRPYGLVTMLAVLLPVGTLIFMFRRWQQHGRDPSGRGTLVVEYDPPKGMSAAEVGVLIDETANIKDVSATIVELAVRGYLKIRELPKKLLSRQDFEFVRLKDYQTDVSLKTYETQILKVIFGGAETALLSKLVSKNAFHASLKAINRDLYGQLVKDGHFPESPEKVRLKYQGIGLAMIFIGFGVGVALLQESLSLKAVYAAMMLFSVSVVGLVLTAFGRAMPRKTQKGVAAFEHARGFCEYLATAEKYRLQWQEKENIFETFLPYAMVFGVADKWTGAFKDIALPPQNWYEGEAFVAGHFNAGNFLASMGALQSGLNRAVSAQPHKSSGGSGFSGGGGGGFGGGGGGSW